MLRNFWKHLTEARPSPGKGRLIYHRPMRLVLVVYPD